MRHAASVVAAAALFVGCGGDGDHEGAAPTRASAGATAATIPDERLPLIVEKELARRGYDVAVVGCEPDAARSTEASAIYQCDVENRETGERRTVGAAVFAGGTVDVDTSLIRDWPD